MAGVLHTLILPFSNKLKQLDPVNLHLDAYPREYLQLILEHKQYYLNIYADVLQKVIENTSQALTEMVLVDYGAGNGLLGMFAKYCGVGQVYLVDNSAPFVAAARQVAQSLKIHIDGFILGDYTQLKNEFAQTIKPGVIVGTDVIEHIYNLDEFFNSIAALNPGMICVFTTASVTSNPLKNKRLMHLQYCDEYVGSNAHHAQEGNMYAGLPFLETRKKIIAEHFPSVNDEQRSKLAAASRGLDKQDLMKVAAQYLKDGIIPKPPLHKTNTCDPVTGSWTERLLSVNEYKLIFQNAGFTLRVYNGFYNQWQGGVKAIGLKLLNKLVVLTGKQGRIITPFITLIGERR